MKFGQRSLNKRGVAHGSLHTFWIVIALLSGCGGSGEPSETTNQAEDYRTLLAAAKRDIINADFTKLRMAWVNSDEYDPFAPSLMNTPILLETFVEADDQEAIRDTCVALLEQCYMNIDAHSYLALSCVQLGDLIKASDHRGWYLGIMQSVLSSGDGLTPETAYQVIDLQEERAAVEFFQQKKHVKFGDKTTRVIDGHHIDIYEADIPNDVELPVSGHVMMHFNIDLPMATLK